jgi:hypothetical protein
MAPRALIVGFVPLVIACVGPRDDPPWHKPPTASPPSSSTSAPVALLPVACDRAEWPTIAASPSAASLAVAANAFGSTIFSVPTAGGDVSAFAVDPKGELLGAPQLLRSGNPYVSVGATYVGDHLVATAIDASGNTFVDVVAADLSTSTEIAKLPAAYVTKTPMLDVWGTPSVPTLASRELDVTTFDTSFAATQTTAIETTRQPIGVDASQIALDGVVAWSTTTDCHVEILGARGTVTSESVPFPCPNVRVAADPATYTTVVVFETAAGVQFFGAWFANITPLERMLAPAATSPRIAFDGSHFWIAFLDQAHGELVAGILTEGGEALVTGLATSPTRDAFELRIVGGDPWVFTSDDAGYHARRICLAPQ